MKRSEMVDIIEKLWSDSSSFKSDRATAEYILKNMVDFIKYSLVFYLRTPYFRIHFC